MWFTIHMSLNCVLPKRNSRFFVFLCVFVFCFLFFKAESCILAWTPGSIERGASFTLLVSIARISLAYKL